MGNKELFNEIRKKCGSDDKFLEAIASMLSSVAGELEIYGSKHDVEDAAKILFEACGLGEDDDE